jgi:hypothetical protein
MRVHAAELRSGWLEARTRTSLDPSLSPTTTVPMDFSSNLGSVSVLTIRNIHPPVTDVSTGLSQPSSPRSSALPSPPDSPDSISSPPSLSSSFFFSSAAASPPHTHAHSAADHDREPTQGLVIPLLTLPAALRQPTCYGKTVGDIRLLAFGSADLGASSSIAGLLLDGNEDVVDVGPSETTLHGHVTRASTDWVEHRDAHGLEKFEPTHNVEILDVSGHAAGGDVRLSSIPWHRLIAYVLGRLITSLRGFCLSFTSLFTRCWMSYIPHVHRLRYCPV